MNVSLRQVKAFLEVARLRSFTRAAENLHISQQGLSLMVRDMEQQFGCRLFDRTTRAVSLTTAGERLLAAAQQAVSSLEHAAAAIGQLTQEARQTLSVAATPLVAATLMPEACARFRQQHPNVTVRLMDVERGQIQRLVESGAVDVGFGVFLRPAAALERRQIFQCELVYLSPIAEAAPDARAPIGRLPWSALSDLPLLGLPHENPVQQLVDTHLAGLSRGNEARPTFTNIPTVMGMVEAGFGGAILPSFVLSAARRMNIGVAVLERPAVPVNFFQVNMKGRARSEAEPAFVDALLQTMAEHCVTPGVNRARAARPRRTALPSARQAGRPA